MRNFPIGVFMWGFRYNITVFDWLSHPTFISGPRRADAANRIWIRPQKAHNANINIELIMVRRKYMKIITIFLQFTQLFS